MWSDEFERRAAEMRERNERDRLALRLGHEHLRIAEATAQTGAIRASLHRDPLRSGKLAGLKRLRAHLATSLQLPTPVKLTI
jgi:hypothetical protein